MNKEYARYFSSIYDGIESDLHHKLVNICYSKTVNRIVKHPFKNLVFPLLYPCKFDNNKTRCYLFFGNGLELINTFYADYLRKQHRGVKIVLFLQDLIKTYKNFDLNFLRKQTDLIISYDKQDADKYGLLYHPTPMSYVKVDEDDSIKESDFYFCGYAKTRYPVIHSLYCKLVDEGYNCDFNVFRLPENVAKVEGINYIKDMMNYEQNLQHVQKTKCIVEIMQDGAVGYTPRLWESIIYDKHLLTNNRLVLDSHFFNERYHHMWDKIDSILDTKWVTEPVTFSSEIKHQLSPTELLSYIDALLS